MPTSPSVGAKDSPFAARVKALAAARPPPIHHAHPASVLAPRQHERAELRGRELRDQGRGCATGADEAYIYCRAEYPLAIRRLRTAIAQAEERNLLGPRIANVEVGRLGGWRLGGRQLRVGPARAPQFFYVLLDRGDF